MRVPTSVLKTIVTPLLRPQQCYAPLTNIFAFQRHSSNLPPSRPRDKFIKYRMVRLVDPETGGLQPFAPLANILAAIDRTTHFVELVTETPEPIVKLISKQEANEKRREQKAKQKELKAKAREQKEVQMTWGVAAGDMAHKLKKVRQELVRGNRVDLVFAPKKGQKWPTPEEMVQRANQVVDDLKDVGKEWKERAVSKHTTIIRLQGELPKDSQ
ncbi:hypothetical protein JAAARDRAFT_146426 [Jaapia argillacea MUCL 33604]|uniref:Translation initiation factor 3 N-terminal domain-containing protein n=1 Tax=Jaapia argillacea MUCL 33604 TaxID=933084 RepID=A0A067QDC9_9AGAM|nr:hypothetical protein JAAARDRAFT_146426 [Jaapia argillacea MUCL 33604]